MEAQDNNRLFLIAGIKAGSMVITTEAILFSSKSYSDSGEFMDAWGKTLTLISKEKVKFDAIKSISQERGDNEILLKYRAKLGMPGERKFEFSDDEDRDDFFSMMQARGFMKSENKMSQWKATAPYLFGLAITIGLGVYGYITAKQLESGIYEDAEGYSRGASRSRLMVSIVEKLGSNGVVSVGGAIALIILYLIWKRFTNPPDQTVLQRNN